ncbi:MAG: SDR family NAD(P)-dependent oxidoreductase [Sandaracinaceae bacterium]
MEHPTDSRTYVLTGGTSGVGLGVLRGLAAPDVRLFSLCRNEERGRAAAEGLPGTVEVVACDLSSPASVEAAAAAISERAPSLDGLVSCAGVAPWNRTTTPAGTEVTWATNVLGTHRLERALLPQLERGAPSRVVIIAGDAHRKGRIHWDDPELQDNYSPMRAGTQSVLAKIMLTNALSRRMEGTGVTANTFCPAFVKSGLTRGYPGFLQPFIRLGHLFAQTPEQGARTPLWLVQSPDVEGLTGRFFRHCAERATSAAARDGSAQERLFELVERATPTLE